MDGDAVSQRQMWDAWADHNDDILYADRDPAAAVGFLTNYCRGGSAVELGAGSGRVAIPLALQGVHVTAVEISERLCQSMRRGAPGQLAVVQGDMVEFKDGSHDLVYLVHSTIFHATTQLRQSTVVRNAASMLAADGRLVLSCYRPDALAAEADGRARVLSHDGDRIALRITKADASTQLVEFNEVTVGTIGTSSFRITQRYAWPAELDLMATNAGLVLEGRYESWDLSPYTHSSPKHVSVYRREAHSKGE